MKKLIIIYLLLFNSVTFANDAIANKGPSDDSPLVTVTGHPDYSPVSFHNKTTNSIDGIAASKLKDALIKMGVRYKFVFTGTWARAQEEVKLGRIDILLPPYRTDERESWLHFQKIPFMMDETAIFVPKNKLIKFDQLSDLLKFRGVAIINDSFGDEFDKFDKDKLKLKRLATTEQCFKFLLKDRADFLVAGLHAGNRVLQSMKQRDNFIILPKRVIVTGMYAGISKKSPFFLKHPELIKELEQNLFNLKN